MRQTRSRLLLLFIAIQITACFLPGELKANYYGPNGDIKKAKTISILTIGNSYARNAITFLPEIASSVKGYEINITTANIGGASLEKHVENIELCEQDSIIKPYSEKFCLEELLSMKNYDYITIQQKSTLSFLPSSYQPYLDLLFNFIKEHSPDAEILIHQTWAYAPDCKRFDQFGISREEMHQGLQRNYNAISIQYELDILPSGNAFYQSFKKKPELDLWVNDRYHANINGCYLSGCVWFGKLFGVSPKKITFVPEGMDPNTAKFLRNIAAKELISIESN